MFGNDISIDLGTATMLVYIKGKGIVMNEPTVIAVNTDTNEVVGVGAEALEMIGRTPPNIKAVHPLHDGVIIQLYAYAGDDKKDCSEKRCIRCREDLVL